MGRRHDLVVLFTVIVVGFAPLTVRAEYVGSVAGPGSPTTLSAGTEVLGNGGGSGTFTYKGGGNAVDAAVAAALTACVVSPQACSLGGYGGHMLIYKAGWDGDPRLLTCIDFNSTAGSLASSNMFVGNINLTNGQWTGPQPPASRIGWKAVGVPGTFAGLFMAQTNYGRKVAGTNYFPFAEIMKPVLARVANGQVSGNSYYSLSSVSNLLMDLYTNSPGYRDGDDNPNPNSSNDPYGVFYKGDIALDIVAAMQANGGLVTYADMTNYRPLEVVPYMRHFSCPNGTPATVYVAPPGSAGVSVLQQLAIIEALDWTNGPNGTWNSLQYWHSRAEAARFMWKDHYQWLGDPWSGVLPPDFLGNGNTNFCDQLLAHATNGYPNGCPWDPAEVVLTNSLAGSIVDAVNGQTNNPISVDWDDIRYGTLHISTSDKWGNCVSVTLSMGGGFGAQVAVTNRGLVLGQGMALFDARPGWPDSIAPGKRPVHNMCPAIVLPDTPASPTNSVAGGRPPFAVGGGGGSTIENNRAMQLVKYLMDPPSSSVVDPAEWLYNFEGNNIIYMRPSYPAGVQTYLANAGYSAPGGPPSVGDYSYVQAWIAPTIVTPPANTTVPSGSTATFHVTATGLPLFYQWFRNGIPLTNSALVSGAQTAQLTLSSVTSGSTYSVIITNGGASVTSAPVTLTVESAPAVAKLSFLWGVGPLDGKAWMNTNTALTQHVPNQRTIAYNALSNHLYVISRSSSTTSNYVIYVLNATTGAFLYTLKTNGIQSGVGKGGIGLLGIAAADDGAIYACNESNDSAGGGGSDPASYFRVYRWANAHSNTTPTQIFIGDPSGTNAALRWGDTLEVRGTGTNTQLLLDMNNIISGNRYAAILSPANQFMTNFSPRWLLTTNFGSTIGRSLEFDLANNALWQKSATKALVKTTFNPAASLGATQISSTTALVATNFPSGLMGMGLDLTRHLAAGVCSNGTTLADTLNLYDITDLNAPALLGQFDFPMTPRVPNANWISQTFFKNDLLFSIDANNGLLVFRVSTGTARLTDFAKLPNGAFQFGYSNSAGWTYSIFASSNLTDWTPIGSATQTAPGRFQFSDPEASNHSQRFYQLRAP